MTRVGMVSLGCAKNLVDSEVMLGHLARAGCELVRDLERAELIIVNTCSFIEAAREESIQTILEVAELKRTAQLRRLVVAGCLVQRYPEQLRREIPEVDAFIGLDELGRVVSELNAEGRSSLSLVGSGSAADAAVPWSAASYLYDHATPRQLATPPWTAYVKIAEGCNHTCAFCAIPSFRGQFRSRDPQSVVAEAEQLAAQGVVELNLIAQDSSHYGRDLDAETDLAGLLEQLNEVREIRWIRVHYLYPNTITPRLIETMARLPRVVPYVDLPLQHAARSMLQRMRRGGSALTHHQLLDKFRQHLPDVALRSTFIVGFPGETADEFQELLDFVDEARLDHLGVFTYSHEEGTHAQALDDDVPEATKQERYEQLMERQRQIVAEHNAAWLGRSAPVLLEGAHPETEHLLVGRTCRQARDVDGVVLINDGVHGDDAWVKAGTLAQVEFTEVAGYDLVGRIVGQVGGVQ